MSNNTASKSNIEFVPKKLREVEPVQPLPDQSVKTKSADDAITSIETEWGNLPVYWAHYACWHALVQKNLETVETDADLATSNKWVEVKPLKMGTFSPGLGTELTPEAFELTVSCLKLIKKVNAKVEGKKRAFLRY